jgi:hypothetical protein
MSLESGLDHKTLKIFSVSSQTNRFHAQTFSFFVAKTVEHGTREAISEECDELHFQCDDGQCVEQELVCNGM